MENINKQIYTEIPDNSCNTGLKILEAQATLNKTKIHIIKPVSKQVSKTLAEAENLLSVVSEELINKRSHTIKQINELSDEALKERIGQKASEYSLVKIISAVQSVTTENINTELLKISIATQNLKSCNADIAQLSKALALI